ncbi:hypothetical protein ACHHYP_15685 [Achlya hypogyna]|uniref:CDK5RAP3-like protein n=1 Tax=Achlya hypogyna TaxID=1202772 RepID=A0A1V9YAE6_ACHHY|nr:hypothetical protein ACHHYP_15685 [Achlya hypogyna]
MATAHGSIDLPLKKLLEGLIDRKIVPPQWQDMLRPVRAEIAVAVSALPDHARKVLAGKELDDLLYFDCKAILGHLLASDEAKQTNFFGQYTSPVLKAWIAIVKSYEANSLFAAEAARRLHQNAAFEIPALRKAITQHEKHVADNLRKVADLQKSIVECNKTFAASCASLKIPGFDIRLELQALVYDLQGLFAEVAALLAAPAVCDAGAYHAALQGYLNGSRAAPRLAALTAFWATPVHAPAPVSMDDSSPVEIQWTPASVGGEEPTGSSDIDWGIEVAGEAIDWGITAVETPHVPEIAPQTQVDLLLHAESRAQITNDLLELRAFLAQRRVELKTPDLAFANQFQTCNPLVAQQSLAAVDTYLQATDSVLAALRDKRLQHVLLIKVSPRYLARLVSTLELQMGKGEKLQAAIRDLQDKNAELIDTVATSHEKLRSLAASTMELQRALEAALPALFKGHHVRILSNVSCGI